MKNGPLTGNCAELQPIKLEIAAHIERPPQGGRPSLHLPAYDAWDGLGLEYRLAWPLHLLLTPGVMGQYAALFRFLLRLKRACAELDGAWAALRGFGRARASDPNADPGGRRALWHLRHRMAHLVGNLQVYMQVPPAILTLRQIGPQTFRPVSSSHLSGFSMNRVAHRRPAGTGSC